MTSPDAGEPALPTDRKSEFGAAEIGALAPPASRSGLMVEALLGAFDHGLGRANLGLARMARDASTSMMMPNFTSIR